MFNLDFPSIFPIAVVLSWNSSLSHSPHDALAVQAGQECCEPDMFSKSSPKQKRSKTTEKLSRSWQPKSKTWTLWEVYFKFAHEGSTLEKVELGAQLCCRWPISCVEAMDITYNLHKFWGSLPSLFLPWEGSMAKKLRLVTFATPLQKWRSYRRRNKKSGNFHGLHPQKLTNGYPKWWGGKRWLRLQIWSHCWYLFNSWNFSGAYSFCGNDISGDLISRRNRVCYPNLSIWY